MKISHNIPALQSHLSILKADKATQKSMLRLSSGVKIASAKDDAAGLSISNKLKTQLRGLEKASSNAMDGISLVQTAEGALTEVHSMLGRLKELSVQAANGTLEPSDRQKIQMEVRTLLAEIDDISYRTEFNKTKLLYGDAMRLAMSSAVTVAQNVYISETVPPGNLNYDVISAGVPAKSAMTIPTIINNSLVGTLTINGFNIAVEAGDTPDVIKQKILEMTDMAGLEIRQDGSDFILTTVETGSRQSISITSDNAALYAALNPVTTTGKDAVVKLNSYTDANGNNIVSFMSGMNVVTDGNRLEVTSLNGQRLLIDLQLVTMPDGSFEFKNGAVVSDTGVIGSTINMTMSVKDYGPLIAQIGPNKNQEIEISIAKVSTSTLGLKYTNMQTIEGASTANGKIEKAISDISTIRGRLGAYQNRLESTVRNLDSASTNTAEARSRIYDTDMAAETTEMTKYNVISQAAIAILGQANQRPQQILALLR